MQMFEILYILVWSFRNQLKFNDKFKKKSSIINYFARFSFG